MARFTAFFRMLPLVVLTACASPHGSPATGRLDDLFSRLRATTSAAEAAGLQAEIQHAWASTGKPQVDDVVARGLRSLHGGDFDQALAAFDRVVREVPGYAEGYYLRAAVYSLRDQYDEAILDLDQALRLEPRHYGALTEMAQIMLMMGQKGAALQALDAALAINPHLTEAKEEADSLRDDVAGLPL